MGDARRARSAGAAHPLRHRRHLPDVPVQPGHLAQAFASLGVLYPGRVFLGVGTGEALNEVPTSGQWGDYQERADRLVEAVAVIRKLWTGEWVTHNGRYYQIESARLYDVPSQPAPLYIAAEGPKSMHLAGMHGDRLISDSKTAMQPEMRAAFEAGAREAGKNPETMPILAKHFVVGGEVEKIEAANCWRFIPAAWQEFVENPDPRSILQHAEREIPDDKAAENWTVSEDPDAHITALQQLIDGGMTQIYVHSGQNDQHRAIQFLRKGSPSACAAAAIRTCSDDSKHSTRAIVAMRRPIRLR